MLTAVRSVIRAWSCRSAALLYFCLCVSASAEVLAEEVKVAFIGDQGVGSGARSVLELIRDEGTDLLLIQGDLGYDPDTASQWIDNIDSILGENFPVLMVVGNHENYEWPRYHQWQKDKLGRVNDINCEGEVSVKAYCTYKKIGVVQVAPGIVEVDGINGNDNYADYITEKLSSDDSNWRICSWHKNMRDMQVGGKGDSTGWGVYKNCLAQGGISIAGHEHSYSRTYLMSDFQNKQVIHNNNNMDIGPGSSISIVSGLGGRQPRPQLHGGNWFASIYTASQNANPGSLFCTFTGKQADCYFKDIAGLVPDSFTLASLINTETDDLDAQAKADAEAAEQIAQDEADAQAQADADAAERAAQDEAAAQAQADADAAERAAQDEAAAQAQADADAAERAAQDEATAQAQADADAAEQAAQDEAAAQAQADADATEQAAAQNDADALAQANSDAAEQAAQDEADAQEQADADAAEQVSQDAADAQAQADAAEQASQDEPNAQAQADADGANAAGPPHTITDVGPAQASSASNATGTVPTDIADAENTYVVDSAALPTPAIVAASGGGTFGCLSLCALSLMLTMRRVFTGRQTRY